MKASAILVGRGIGSGIRVACRDVSRRHCALIPQGRGFLVRDLESANGTWIAGRRVHVGYAEPGDVITVGSYQLRVDDNGRISSHRQQAPATTVKNHIAAWSVMLSGAVVALGALTTLGPGERAHRLRAENSPTISHPPLLVASMKSSIATATAFPGAQASGPFREAHRGPWVYLALGHGLAQCGAIDGAGAPPALPGGNESFEIEPVASPIELQHLVAQPEPAPQLDAGPFDAPPLIPIVNLHEIAALLAVGRERIDGFQSPPPPLEPLREIVAGLLANECDAAVDALLELRAQCQGYVAKLATRLRRSSSTSTQTPGNDLERTIARDLRAQLSRVLKRQHATLESLSVVIDDALAQLQHADSWRHALRRVLTTKDVLLQKRFVKLVATQQRSECVPLLVERLSSVSYQVSNELYKALDSLTGARPGRSASAWRKWLVTQER